MKKHLVKLSVLCLSHFLFIQGNAQNSEFKLQNYHPASPSAFEFLKYSEMPVSEYTGIPNISVPLYEIKEDGLSIPVTLAYHAGGIRLNQESSWVGLGWDLNFGSIVQEINDMDDYGIGIIRKRPDYNNSPIPQEFPYRYTYTCANTTNPGWYTPVTVNSPQPYHSYMISTDYYVPINGNFDDQLTGRSIFTDLNYDSEPDIFKANFLGHSISFTLDFNTNQIVVLNKKGYSVTRNGSTYTIVVPSGEQFLFEVSTTVTAYSQTVGGLGGSNTSILLPSSKIWMLTKIITRNKRQIIFNYTQTGEVNNYPSYSEKFDKYSPATSWSYTACTDPSQIGYPDISLGDTAKTFSFSKEPRLFLTSIVYPNGEVDFSTSNRNDMLGGKKLDTIQIKGDSLVKTYQFNYSYFDASGVGGNIFQPFNATSFGSTPLLRLKLLSINDNSGAVHSFSYNQTQLPPKNSFAQDFWGFCNGQLSNTSLIPNPSRINKPALGNNGNNNSANLQYAQAAILNQIVYPTGGKVSFEYELNQFDNYWVPDFSSTTNTISNGNGLRIHAVNFSSDTSSVSKRTVYTYSGGKAIVPIDMYRQFSINGLHLNSAAVLGNSNYSIDELNARGFFTTNTLGSINSVGYDKVIKEEIDANNITNGRIESYFNNTPDRISNSASGSSQLSAVLPAIKRTDVPENGTIKSISYYNNQNRLVRKVENAYRNIVSSIFYGARIFGYSSLFYGAGTQPSDIHWTSVSQTLIGYYPIYDYESLLDSSKTKEYSDSNDSLSTTIIYSYDSFDQLTFTKKTTSTAFEENYYTHGYNDLSTAPNTALLNNNRLTDLIRIEKYRRELNNYQSKLLSSVSKEYSILADKIVESKLTLIENAAYNTSPGVITFDQYDTNGNVLQFTNKGAVKSLLWNYNNEYVVAEAANASSNCIAYTSFESSGTGNWNYSGSTSLDAITGKKSYQLSTGNIIISSIPAKNYIVTYWSKNGSYNVNGSVSTVVGLSLNGWTLYTHILPNANSVTISGNGLIDEVRLYPQESQMSTYTYNPLIGITSSCDINNRITYYEYDGYNRLSIVRDQNKNIIKRFDYLYQAPNNSNAFWQTISGPTCQQSGGQNTGYQVTVQRDKNPISATYNQQQTITVYNTAACPMMANVTYSNAAAVNIYMTLTNTTTNLSYNFTLYPGSPVGTVAGQVPIGTYNVSMSSSSSTALYNYQFYTFSSAGVNTANFYNVSVCATCAVASVSNY